MHSLALKNHLDELPSKISIMAYSIRIKAKHYISVCLFHYMPPGAIFTSATESTPVPYGKCWAILVRFVLKIFYCESVN